MQKIYHKSILGIAVMFFFSSYGQTGDEVKTDPKEREIHAFQKKYKIIRKNKKMKFKDLKA